MSFLPDPDEFYAIADRIAGHASAARSRATDLGIAIAGTDWHGVAAGTFQLMAGGVPAGLRRAADRLDDAADALRRHAGNVRHVLDALAGLGHDVLGLGLDLDRVLLDSMLNPSQLLDDGVSVIGDVADVLGDVGDLLGIS